MLQACTEVPAQVFRTEPAASEVVELSGIRQIIAERMTMSVQTNASVTLHTEVDATSLVELRELFGEKLQEQGVKLTYTDLIVKIIANALRETSTAQRNTH